MIKFTLKEIYGFMISPCNVTDGVNTLKEILWGVPAIRAIFMYKHEPQKNCKGPQTNMLKNVGSIIKRSDQQK